MDGRVEVTSGSTIGKSLDRQEVIACETNDMTINVADGATPYLFIDNAPSWVQGSAPSEATAASYTITYKYYTHTLQGSGFSGNTRVVKQGDGILTYPEKDMAYSGPTDVWAGTLNLNGSIANSPLWLNRLTTLNTPAKSITVKSLKADYGATVNIGGTDVTSVLMATDSMMLGFGSRLKMDIYSANDAADVKTDQIETAKLVVEKKDWKYGPEYKQPVIEFNCHFNAGEDKLATGKYYLGTVNAVAGDIANIKIEGISKVKAVLAIEDGKLVLNIEGTREAADIDWSGTYSDVWDLATTENFVTHDVTHGSETFIEGDNIYFTDDAKTTKVTIPSGVEVKPSNIYYTASKAYTIGGSGRITSGAFYHNGTGTITMSNDNTYTGGNHLTGGTTIVTSLSNATQAYGNLGGVTTVGSKFSIENGAVLQNTAAVTNGSLMRIVGKGVIKTDATFAQQANVGGDTLVKAGSGALNMSSNLVMAYTIVKGGSMDYSGSNYTKTLELQGNASVSGKGFIASPLHIAAGAKAAVTTVNRATTSSKLTGSGQVTIYCATEKGSGWYATRTPLELKMTDFTGTLVAGATYSADGRFTLSTASGSNQFTLNIPAGIIVQNSGKTLSIGKLTGSGTLGGYCTFSNGGSTGKNTWNVGNDEDFTFAGKVTSADIFNKVGKGTMTVSNSWENTGAVNVNGGNVSLGQGCTLGTGALVVADGAALMGMSSILRSTSKSHPFTNSSVTINGALGVGADGQSSAGYWYFGTKSLTFGATGKLYVGVLKCATSTTAPGCTHIWGDETSGSVTFKDGATISVYLDSSYNPATCIGTDEAKADSFMVFNFAKATVGDVKFELPELPDHYYWDTTNFKKGYLYIRYTASTGIRTPFADNDRKNIYDLKGRLVRRMSTATDVKGLPGGIYIRGGRAFVVR